MARDTPRCGRRELHNTYSRTALPYTQKTVPLVGQAKAIFSIELCTAPMR